jgi:hypothetical protein
MSHYHARQEICNSVPNKKMQEGLLALTIKKPIMKIIRTEEQEKIL